MPVQKVTREEVISRLLAVFRLHGYEGASMAMIAEKVGLRKASLYHLFPGGKEEMAGAVLGSIGEYMEEKVLKPLRGEGSPQARLEAMIDKVRSFYQGGKCSCLFETMSLGTSDGPFRATIQAAMTAWIEAMTKLAKEHGASTAVARERAERVITSIQGSLVVARCMSDPGAFTRALRGLPDLLLPAA
jgi:AcrR family transcriptional regulator